jgi:hypothetical protein
VTLVLRLWLEAVGLGAASVLATILGSLLIRRADPDELMELAARNQRWAEAWGRSVARASGGWTPPDERTRR